MWSVETLGKAIALVACWLGAPLLPGSHLGLQTRTDGVIRFILADYEASGRLRGYASFDAEKLAHLDNGGKPPQQSVLIGKGHLALTLANGIEEDRYQGIVELDDHSIHTTTTASRPSCRPTSASPLRVTVRRRAIARGAGVPAAS